MAGLSAGVTEAFLANPFEVVKVTLQANRSATKELPSTWSVTKAIIKKDGLGLKGLNKGITATIGRNGLFNMVYFGFYHSVKGYLPEFQVKHSTISPMKYNKIMFLTGSNIGILKESWNWVCVWNIGILY